MSRMVRALAVPITASAAFLMASLNGQDGFPPQFVGSWSGNVFEESCRCSYMYEIEITGGALGSEVGTFSYTTLCCGGTLTYRESSDDVLQLTETYTFNECNNCISVNGARVTLRLIDAGKLRYEWRHPSRDAIEVSGLLTRQDFLRGDCNADGAVDITDAVCTLTWLFLGGPAPGCVSATNVDGVGEVDITDPIYLLTYLFLGGPEPVDPFPECGPGEVPTDKTLGCDQPPENCR